jgi:hypothetical protein
MTAAQQIDDGISGMAAPPLAPAREPNQQQD